MLICLKKCVNIFKKKKDLQFVVEFVEMTQVQSSVERPASHSQIARLSFDDLGVAEERVEYLPQQDQRSEAKIENSWYIKKKC